jgi:uncharacterized membrane protein
MHDLALLLHLLGAFVFVAGTTVAGVAFEAARRAPTPREVALLLGLTRAGVLLIAVGIVLILIFGLWLVDLGRFGYGAAWLDASLALLLASVIFGAIGGQRPKRARKLAVAQSERAQVSPELRALLEDRLARSLNYLSVLLIFVIVALMVIKPGATHV